MNNDQLHRDGTMHRIPYSMIGSAVRYFFVGVNCSPLSICSHNVNPSYSFWFKSNGIPVTQWNMRKVDYKYEGVSTYANMERSTVLLSRSHKITLPYASRSTPSPNVPAPKIPTTL